MGRRQKINFADLVSLCGCLIKLFLFIFLFIFLVLILSALLSLIGKIFSGSGGTDGQKLVAGFIVILVIIILRFIFKKRRSLQNFNSYIDIEPYGNITKNSIVSFLFKFFICSCSVYLLYMLIMRPTKIEIIPLILSFFIGSLIYLFFWKKAKDKKKLKTERENKLIEEIREKIIEKFIDKYGVQVCGCDKCGEPLIFQEESPHMSSAKFVCAYCEKEKLVKAIKDIDLTTQFREMSEFSSILNRGIEISIQSKNAPSNCHEKSFKREPIPEHIRHEVWRRDQGMCVDAGAMKTSNLITLYLYQRVELILRGI